MRKLSLGAAYLVAGVVGGLASAIYASGTSGSGALPNEKFWREWQITPGTTLAAYTVAHFLAAGEVPPPSPQTRSFFRSRDDEGNLLRADCVFELQGNLVPARWWSVALSAKDGGHSELQPLITSDDAVTMADGRMTITVAKYPTPGNWMKPVEGQDFIIYYTISNPVDPAKFGPLPSLKRVGC